MNTRYRPNGWKLEKKVAIKN